MNKEQREELKKYTADIFPPCDHSNTDDCNILVVIQYGKYWDRPRKTAELAMCLKCGRIIDLARDPVDLSFLDLYDILEGWHGQLMQRIEEIQSQAEEITKEYLEIF